MATRMTRPIIRWETCSSEVLAQASDTRLRLVAHTVDQDGLPHDVPQPIQSGTSLEDAVGQAKIIAERCIGGKWILFGQDPKPYQLRSYDVLLDNEVIFQIRLELSEQKNPEEDEDRGY